MTFQQWQSFAQRVRARADRINRAKTDRGFAIAASAGIGRDMCCIHNASIADVGRGWGAGVDGRATIKTARRALRVLDDFTEHRIADRIIAHAWKTVSR